jgi:hypothetical protein
LPLINGLKCQLCHNSLRNLITSLKIFSLSSAVMGCFGLPGLILYRGMDIYSEVHMAMVITTMFGSLGSTVGLHYIFAPYVYTLEKIPVRKCSYKKQVEESIVAESEGEKKSQKEQTQQQESSAVIKEPSCLLKATTRSIFATRVEHVFDPETDITKAPDGTLRPFCSFFCKGKPLYIHEQMISDPKLSKNLFKDWAETIKKQKNPDPDDDFL